MINHCKPRPPVRVLTLLLLASLAALANGEYAGPFDDESSLSEEEQRSRNDVSLATISGLIATHNAGVIAGFVPEPVTSLIGETVMNQADMGLKYTKAYLVAPPNLAIVPESNGGCEFELELPQTRALYTNNLGLTPRLGKDFLLIPETISIPWTNRTIDPPRDETISFGPLGVPEIAHANSDVILRLDSPSAGISSHFEDADSMPRTYRVPAGAHGLTWRAETQVNPFFDMLLPAVMTPLMASAEFKFGKYVDGLRAQQKARNPNRLVGSLPQESRAELVRMIKRFDRRVGFLDFIKTRWDKGGRNSQIKELVTDILNIDTPSPLQDNVENLIANLDAEAFVDLLFLGGTTVDRARFQQLTVYDQFRPSISTSVPSKTLEATDIGGTTYARYAVDLAATITASDACDRAVTLVNDAPEVLPLGQTVVTWTVRDQGPALPAMDPEGLGHFEESITQTIFVEDTQAPILVPPPGLVVESDSPIDLDDHPLGQPLVVDLADLHPEVTKSIPGGTTIVEPGFRTVVTWSATDDGVPSPNMSTGDQLVTVKLPGSNTPPSAAAKSAETLTSKPVDIVLTGTDPDLLPYSHDPGGAAVPDPLQFRIDSPPQHGEFVAPLHPFFINDYRTDKRGSLIDYINAQPDAEALMAVYVQAVNTNSVANFLNDEFCAAGSEAPIDFVFEPLFMHVSDAGEQFFLDHYLLCDPNGTGSPPWEVNPRISRWDQDGSLLGQVGLDQVDGGIFDEEAFFQIDAQGFVYFVNVSTGGEPVLSIQHCKADLTDTGNPPPTCPTDFGPIDGNNVGPDGRAPRNAFIDMERELVYVTTNREVAVFDFRETSPGGPRHTSSLIQRLANDAGSDQVLGHDAGAVDPGLLNSMVVDSAGNLYVSDVGSSRIHKFARSGFDADGNFVAGDYIGWMGRCDGSNNQACEDGHTKGFSCTAAAACTVSQPHGSEIGQFDRPAFIAMDPNDTLYVADYGNQRIQRFGVDGTFAGVAASTGNGINAKSEGGFVLGNMGPPKHVSVNSTNFYVVDQSENFVHVFDTSPFKDLTSYSATVTYVSEFAFHNAADSFTYSVDDGLARSPGALVTVQVARNYRQPQPTAQAVTVDEDETIVIVLSGSDPDGVLGRDFNGLDTLSFAIVDEPAHGTLAPGGDAGDTELDPGMEAWTYTPGPDFFGEDSFTFRVRDQFTDAADDNGIPIPEPYGDAPPATVGIAIASVNDVPILELTQPDRVAAGFPMLLGGFVFDDFGSGYAARVLWGDGAVDHDGRFRTDDNGTPGVPEDDTVAIEGIVYSDDGLSSIGQSPINAVHTFGSTGSRTIRLCFRDGGRLETCRPLQVEVRNLVVMAVDLELDAARIRDGVAFGGRITASNSEPAGNVQALDAENAVLSLAIPEELELQSATSASAACNLDAAVLTCSLGSLAPGETATVDLAFAGTGSLVYDTSLDLVAELRSDTPGLEDVAAGSASVYLQAVDLDRDGDGLPNIYEAVNGIAAPNDDADGDGLDNAAELDTGTSPVQPDTDGDGVSDADEVTLHESDPLQADSDNDGLADADEINVHGTNPSRTDSDGDGLPDNWELENGFDPLLEDSNTDTDGDGLDEADEYANGTDHLDGDSDDDSLGDAEEVLVLGSDPLAADTDEDGLDDPDEANAGTRLTKPDTDDDGLYDGTEVFVTMTDPLRADSDRDGMPDGFEDVAGRDPLHADYALAAGGLSSCALTDAGVECWGRNDFGQAPAVVPGLNDPQEVTVGFVHGCAVDRAADGSRSVVCWGANTFGQSTPPALNDPLHVAAGGFHSCALDRTGAGRNAVLCWGRDDLGQVSGVPAGLENPVRLVSSISGSSSCVLDDKAAGPELICWGQYNNGNSAVPADLGGEVGALALGSEHGCVMNGGQRLCWGLNTNGQAPAGPVAGTAVELSLGGFHSCALSPAAMGAYSVSCWGLNANGQASVLPALVRPIGLASGSHHSCALDQGSAKCWGVENQFDQGQAPDTRALRLDPDGDGVLTAQEMLDGTDPLDADSDRDGLDDAAELLNGTDPLNADSDDDELQDGDEIGLHATDPLDADTDNDGMPDGWEVEHALQPTVGDAARDEDGDGLSNGREHAADADPNEADSDGDGLGDGAEVLFFRYRDSGQALGSLPSEAVELGDLDGDGDLDAFVANRIGGSAIWTNDGSGMFSRSTDNALSNLEALDVDLADIDGDGDLDAVLAHPLQAQSNTLWINGAGGAPEGLFSDSGQDLGQGVSDGVEFGLQSPFSPLPGLFVANWGANKVYNFPEGQAAEGTVVDLLAGNSEDVALGDLNGDSVDDAFVVNRDQPNQVFLSVPVISIPEATPPLSLEDTAQALGGDASSIAVALGDLDGDGDLDAYEVVFGAGDRIWLNDGAANFTDSGQTLGNDGGNDVSLFDVEGDGDLDAFVANSGANKLWLNAGDGTMIDSGLRMGNATSLGLSLGDLDGDGDTDAFIANDGPNAVWLFSQLDPADPDSDGDGTYDGWEAGHGFDPLDDADAGVDSDGDGLGNVEEFDAATDPLVPDTDGDGMPDGFEIANGLDPLDDDADLDLDRDGVSNLTEYQSGAAVYGDDVPPELSAPDDISANSTGQFTDVALGSAIAVDARDGAVSATADDSGPFLPGAHTVTWSASDRSGNLAQNDQAVDVVPQVNFATDQTVDEGNTVQAILELNGPAVHYPVQVNYTVSGPATSPHDHDAATGSVMINSGTSAAIPIRIVADFAFEGEETLTLTIAETVNAVPGPQSTHTISITQTNVMPVARIVAEQDGRPATTLARDGGPVTISAAIIDPNIGDSHGFDWTVSDSGVFDPADAHDESFIIDPATLNPGFYRVSVLLADTGVPAALNRSDTMLRVIATAPALAGGEDTDGDGIDDATEGFGDDDGDRVPDHLDAFPGSNVLAYAAGQRVLETQTGLSLRLGETAFRIGPFAGVHESVLVEDVEYGYPNGLADFEVLGAEPGTAAMIVLPLEHPLPGNARYRKFVGTGWQDFVVDAGNRIASAPGGNGACPAPGSTHWSDGLTAGHGCLQLTVVDGGPNDSDLAINGVIRDPGGLAVPVGVSLSMLPVADREVTSGSRGNVILALRLSSDSGDAELDALTLVGSGSGDDAEISAVRLYVDDNRDGVVNDGDEEIASGTYSGDNGTLELRMSTPYPVPAGETDLLVAYDF